METREMSIRTTVHKLYFCCGYGQRPKLSILFQQTCTKVFERVMTVMFFQRLRIAQSSTYVPETLQQFNNSKSQNPSTNQSPSQTLFQWKQSHSEFQPILHCLLYIVCQFWNQIFSIVTTSKGTQFHNWQIGFESVCNWQPSTHLNIVDCW